MANALPQGGCGPNGCGGNGGGCGPFGIKHLKKIKIVYFFYYHSGCSGNNGGGCGPRGCGGNNGGGCGPFGEFFKEVNS